MTRIASGAIVCLNCLNAATAMSWPCAACPLSAAQKAFIPPSKSKLKTSLADENDTMR